MAIENYTDLIVTAGQYANRNDAVQMAPMFLGLLEGKLNRTLRTREMEKVGTVALTSGVGTVPSDFLEARDVRRTNGGPLRASDYADLANITYGGLPSAFAVVGNELRATPIWTGSLNVVYYAKIPPLTPAAPTNWLLQSDPNVYLYGLVEEICIWSRDIDSATAARALKDEAVQGLMNVDTRLRFGLGKVTIGGPTP